MNMAINQANKIQLAKSDNMVDFPISNHICMQFNSHQGLKYDFISTLSDPNVTRYMQVYLTCQPKSMPYNIHIDALVINFWLLANYIMTFLKYKCFNGCLFIQGIMYVNFSSILMISAICI